MLKHINKKINKLFIKCTIVFAFAIFFSLSFFDFFSFSYDNLASLSIAIMEDFNKSNSNSFQNSNKTLEDFNNPYIAFDLDSNEIYYGKDINKKVYPASLTKIFTCLLFVENANMNFDKNIDLAYKTLYKSDNDSANKMAEQITGNINSFANLMNSRLEKLNLKNTHFVNPSGLHNSNHYTTAKDFSYICKETYNNQEFMKLFFNVNYTDSVDESIGYSVGNKMMKQGFEEFDKRVFAGKNGYTKSANHTLASFAKINDRNVLALVFNESEKNCYTITKLLFQKVSDVNYTKEEKNDIHVEKVKQEFIHSYNHIITIIICLIFAFVLIVFHKKIVKMLSNFIRKTFDNK